MNLPDAPIRVLHVDDEPEFANLAATFVEREDGQIRVETATSASEGLRRLGEEGFDCVVSDYDMPGQNGIEFLDSVRQEDSELPFILFTGKGSEEVASDAISGGVTDYLQKQGGTDQYVVLTNRIRNAVAKHRAEALVDRAFQAMDQSREGIALLDEGGEFIYVNEAYTEIVGYDQDDLIGEFWERVYPDNQVDRIYEEILPTVPEEGRWTGDTVYQRKDGSRITVNHALAYSEEGTMICLLRDLTDVEAQEQTLLEERQRFDLFVDAVDEYAIFMLDPEGYIISWNQGAERIKGYTKDEILGEHFSTFYPEEQRSEGIPDQLLERALAEESVDHEGQRVRKDGSTFHAEVVITAIFDEDGTHQGFGKVTKDITERRERERQFELLQTLTQAANDAIITIDETSTIQSANPAVEELFGYEPESVVGERLSMLMSDEMADRHAEAFRQYLETGEKTIDWSGVELRGRHRNGDPIPLSVSFGEVEQAGERFFIGIVRDIREQQEHRRQLKEQNERLEEFVDVVSHDLRNPLNIAEGQLKLLREECDSVHLDPIERSHTRMHELVEDLLELARNRTNGIDPVPVSLDQIVERSWDNVATREAELVSELDGVVRADESRLKQLLENLIGNAVQHGGESVTVRIGELDDDAGFYVEDDGPGIPADERQMLFENGYSTIQNGTGFGLTIVKAVVDAHDWEIQVTESDGGGARFEISSVDFTD